MKITDIHAAEIGARILIDGVHMTVLHREGSLTLLESFGNREGALAVAMGDEIKVYKKYLLSDEKNGSITVNTDEIFARGEDILAKAAVDKSFAEIKQMLPEFYEDAYIALGHPSTERMVTVDRMGNIFRQKLAYETWHPDPEGEMLYSTKRVFGELGAVRPTQSFLDGKYPILFNMHEDDTRILESVYVYDTGTYLMGNALYIRNAVIDKATHEIVSSNCRIIGVDTFTDYNAENAVLSPELFCDSILNFIEYCEAFEREGASVKLPVKELERSYTGTLLTADCLFCGERTRYGHRIYGPAYHDFFPPNFITAIWAYAASGHTLKAGRMAEHILANAIDIRGRVRYRQGDANNYGFSASELGQFLWVLSRYINVFAPSGRLTPYTDKILAMGDFLLSKTVPLDEDKNISVIRTCAEADTNERIHDYLENTLWGIRGLDAICEMCSALANTKKYSETSAELRESVEKICSRFAVDSKYGKLVPFRLDYTALPLTLSLCEDTAYPVTESERKAYFNPSEVRRDAGGDVTQDFTENTYANYRYYPEILSSCLLDAEYSQSIVNLRGKLGGDLLGMIRWHGGMDDWPAYNLALYYIESGETDKFRALLYSHACHHGLIDFHIYYEQIRIESDKMKIRADSSVPSILLNNLMINMMFVHESMKDGTLELLKGVPAEWFGAEFSIDSAATSRGTVSVAADKDGIRVKLSENHSRVRLWLNGFEEERIVRIAAAGDSMSFGNGYIDIPGNPGEYRITLSHI